MSTQTIDERVDEEPIAHVLPGTFNHLKMGFGHVERLHRDGITLSIEDVTPEVAAEWLLRNEQNRSLSTGTVADYGRDFVRGNWMFTCDPIRFDVHGKLVDGQHRLTSCVQTGVAFTALVVRGLSEESVAVLDTGKKRTLANHLTIRAEKQAALFGSTVNFCCRFDRNRLKDNHYPTHMEALEWIEQNPDVRASVEFAAQIYRSLKFSSTAIAASHYLNARVDSEAADSFWREVVEASGLKPGSPVIALNRWIVGSLAKRDRPTAKQAFKMYMRAMKYWRDGTEIRILQVKPNAEIDTWEEGRD